MYDGTEKSEVRNTKYEENTFNREGGKTGKLRKVLTMLPVFCDLAVKKTKTYT
jgi:hypothetical protein